MKKYKGLILFAVILVFLEATVFQYRFFLPHLYACEKGSVGVNDITILENYNGKTSNASVNGNSIQIVTKACLQVHFANKTPLYTLRVLSNSIDKGYKMKIYWTDESSSVRRSEGPEKNFSTLALGYKDYNMYSIGNCKELVVYIENTSKMGDLFLQGFSYNQPGYHFHLIRVVLLFLLGWALFKLFKTRAWALDSNKKHQRDVHATVICAFVCLMLCTFVLCPGVETNTEHCGITKIVYDKPDEKDAYMMQTQALYNGHLYLDTEVSPSLATLENPYDTGERRGVAYTWDFAFFEGKYYCYFGIVPTIFFLLPFRVITGQYFSSYYFAFLLGLGAILMLARIYRRLVNTFFKTINNVLYGFGLFTVLSGSMILFTAARSWFYEIPYNSCLLCSFCAINFAISAFTSKNHWKAHLLLTSIFIALAVGCRPVSGVVLLICLALIFRALKGSSKKEWLQSALLVAAPLCVMAIFLCLINYWRFGSPFDFGSAYQLTITDVRKVSIKNIPVVLTGIVKYLFQTPQVTGNFPFVFTTNYGFMENAQYVYQGRLCGLFAYPICWLVPGFITLRKQKDKPLFAFVGMLLIAALLALLFVAGFGGIVQRYLLDFQWMVVLASVFIGFSFVQNHDTKENAPVSLMMLGMMALSSFMAVAICIMGEYNRLALAYP
ncbi:MAG: hypothetical protein J6Z00_00505, partial [Clostridia bacterium]|nr:hypothetical protein [Clostridia bacterium]